MSTIAAAVIGVVVVAANGVITFAGSTATGSSLSQNVPISKDGFWPFFVRFNTPANTKGEIVGWIEFVNGVPSGIVTWIDPSGVTAGEVKAVKTPTDGVVR